MPLAHSRSVQDSRTRRALLLALAILGLGLVAACPPAQAGRVQRPTAKKIRAAKPSKATRPSGKRATTTLRFGKGHGPGQPGFGRSKEVFKAPAKATAKPSAAKARISAKRAPVGKAKKSSRTASRESRWKAPVKGIKARIAKLRRAPLVRKVARFYAKTTAKMVRRLDAWQSRAPPWLAKTMDGLRTYTLPSIAAYMFARVANDKVFLGTFLVANSVTSNIILPGSIAFGVDPVVATVLNLMTTPLAMGVIVMREQFLRQKAGETISLRDTAKAVGTEYRDFAKLRREASSQAAQAAAH